MYISYYETKIGTISITEENNKITSVSLNKDTHTMGCVLEETNIIKEAGSQIIEYLEGKRKEFNLPLDPKGTPFQKKVWSELLKIPYGETKSYGEIAKLIGNPKASRAVGMANNKNPIWIIIPCHRVIGCDGKLVGYGGGLDIKEKLLILEGSIKC